MIRCDLVLILALSALSLGPGYHVVCEKHTDQNLWQSNPFSDKSLEAPMNDKEVHLGSNEPLPRDARAFRRRNRNQRRRNQKDESTTPNNIVEDNYYNSLDYEYYDYEEVLQQQTLDPGSRRQGQQASSLPRAPAASHSKEPVQSHHEIESGHYDSYQPSQKTSPLPGFLKTLAACVPLSLAAAAIPLGFANLGGGTRTVTLNPAPVTMTVTMSITQMAMDGGDDDEGGGGSMIDSFLIREYIFAYEDVNSEDGFLMKRDSQPETSSVLPEIQLDKRQRPQTSPSPFTNTTKKHKAQPRLSADMVNAMFTPRAIGPTSSLESILNLTNIDEKGESLGNKYLFRIKPTLESNENDVFTLPLTNHLSGNWTFDGPNTSNLIVSKVGDEKNPAEIVRLSAQPLKETMVISEELKHEDVPNLQVQSNIVRKVQQNTSPKPTVRSRLPRLNLKDWDG